MQWEQFPDLLASTGGDVVHLWKATYVRASPAETLWDLPCSLGVQQWTKKLWRRPRTGYAHSLSITLQFPFRALGLSTLYLTSLVSFLSLYFSLRRFHNTTFFLIFLPYCSPPLSLISHPFPCTLFKTTWTVRVFSFILKMFFLLSLLPASRLHAHPSCCTPAFYFPSLVVIFVIVYGKQLWKLLGKRFGLSCINY